MDRSTSSALAHLRVLELGSGVAGRFCGKIFAAFRAEVITVEPPGGDPLRRGLAPPPKAPGGATHSAT